MLTNNIFCSVKLQKFLGSPLKDMTIVDPGNKWGWNAHLFYTERKKCLIFVNKHTYYSLFIPDLLKKDVENFENLFVNRLMQ